MNAYAYSEQHHDAASLLLRGQLERLAEQAPPREDQHGVPWRYQSTYELVLRLGDTYEPNVDVVFPGGTLADRLPSPGRFEQAFAYAAENHLVYVEGYAIWADNALARHHAWAAPIDEPLAIEVVRSTPAAAYLGVAFDAAALAASGGISGTASALTLWTCRTGLNRISAA